MYYYQFNIGDYQTHTSHLEPMEDLAYRRLLDYYYLHETPIPDDIDKISRLIRMRTHTDCIALVLQEFFQLTENGWISERADKEISKTGEKSEKAKASARVRWDKNANALPTQSNSNATQDPIPKTHNPKPKTQLLAPEGVSKEVWESFVKQRKLSRAAISETVINGIAREANKAGWTLEEALAEVATRGWRGFKADWVLDKQKPIIKSFYQQDLDAKKAFIDEMTGKTKNGKETLKMESTFIGIEK
jgi:uncharacterized protein YdaU (DUF1376 family)